MAQLSTSAVVERSWTETLVIGHRGAAAYKPENTIASFKEAIASGAVGTECDVRLSRDGEVMVMHDPTLDRTSRLTGAVKDRRAVEMIAMGVPTLADFLDTTKGRIISVVEIKDGEGVVRKVVDDIRRKGMTAQSMVFSFNAEHIREAKKLEPSLYTVWLEAEPKDLDAHLAKLKEIGADALGVQFRSASETLVKRAHASRIPVFVWTVPPDDEVKRLKSLKVNFIITDHPRDVIRQLAG